MTSRPLINQTILGSGSGCVLLLLLRAGSALLYPGPLWRGGRVEESPQDGPQGCGPVFRRHTEVPSENPVTRPRTRKAGCLEGAPSGCRFSLVPFSLGKQRERNSGGRRTHETALSEADTANRNSMASAVPHPNPLPGGERERRPPPQGESLSLRRPPAPASTCAAACAWSPASRADAAATGAAVRRASAAIRDAPASPPHPRSPGRSARPACARW